MAERTLLLVDDEENILSSLTRLFRRDGYRILRAGGGAQALELLRDAKVGVVLSDHRMPEMTGVELLTQVKERYPETVRIILSGFADMNAVMDAINRGAVYKFLSKPWDDDLLREQVSEAFRHFELAAENERLTADLRASNDELARANRQLQSVASVNLHSLQVAQDVLEMLPLGIIGIDGDGIVAMANRCATESLGASGLVGMPKEAVLPPPLLALCADSAARAPGCGTRRAITLSDGRAMRVTVYATAGAVHLQGTLVLLDPEAP